MTQKKAQKIVQNWLDNIGFDVGDASTMTGKEWNDRGEVYGKNALAVLIIDGSPLYSIFNYGEPSWKETETLNDCLQENGLWYEMMYGWAIAIYPLD